MSALVAVLVVAVPVAALVVSVSSGGGNSSK